MKKKKNKQNIIVKVIIAIIPTTIAAIAAIWAAYISLSQKTMTSENNSGTIIYGDGNQVSIPGDPVTNKKGTSDTKEKVTLTGEMLGYVNGGFVDNEHICMYSNDGYEPIYNFHLLNENKVTIDIQNIFIEVLDYKNFNEFILKNPAGGADMLDIIYWRCTINPEKKRYPSILTGTDENNTEDLSKTQYVSIKESDSGIFDLKIFPDDPGLYEAKVIVEYTSYSGKTKEISSENIKFIYDPNHEVVTEYNGKIYYPEVLY